MDTDRLNELVQIGREKASDMFDAVLDVASYEDPNEQLFILDIMAQHILATFALQDVMQGGMSEIAALVKAKESIEEELEYINTLEVETVELNKETLQ